MWSTSYVPPRTQHLSTVSTEHTNLPHSYPHRRVIEYEPPRSYHHMLSTIHEPTRSWHSISWSMFHQSVQTIHINCTKLHSTTPNKTSQVTTLCAWFEHQLVTQKYEIRPYTPSVHNSIISIQTHKGFITLQQNNPTPQFTACCQTIHMAKGT